MEQHEVEITIEKNGEVKIHIKGAKGKKCLTYAKWLTQIIGNVKEQHNTSEFYEPETKSRINLEQDLEFHE